MPNFFKDRKIFLPGQITIYFAYGLLAYLISVLMIAFLVFPKQEARFQVGEVSRRDYIAPNNIEFVNTDRTNQEIQRAQERIRPIQKVSPQLSQEYISNLEEFKLFIDSIPPGSEQNIGGLFKSLTAKSFWPKLESNGFTQNDLVALITMDAAKRTAFLKVLAEIQQTQLRASITADHLAVQQNQAGVMLRSRGEKIGPIETGRKILAAFIGPNSQVDEETTKKIRENTAGRIKGITEKVYKDEIFLRKGEVITQRHVDILNTLYGPETQKEAIARYKKTITMSLLTLAGFLIFSYFMGKFSSNPLKDIRIYRLFLLQTLVPLLLGILFARSITGEGSHYLLLLPLLVNAWIMTYFISIETSLLSTLFLGIFLALAFNLDRTFLLSSMITGVIASFSIRHDCRHSDMLRGALMVILIGSLTIISVNLLLDESLKTVSIYLLYNLEASVLALLLMVFLTFVYVPLFNIITIYHLFQLSDINHPLVRELQRNAPGSYHHSLMVGDLAEIAADAIGANGFLARVACLYHDIGKAKMPHFFIENQRGRENPHDSYPPSLSRLVVLSHVKDGVQMAKKAHLPKEIIDAISQHHGTTLMAYFYNKALAQSDGNPVDEFNYRYEGPKPQYPEMAVIALADAAESATRSLDEPTPHRVEATVNAIFQQRLLDGQYNDCGLSISQLEKIKDILIDTLNGIYHSRIEYPDVHELRSRFEKRTKETAEAETQDKPAKTSRKKESAPDSKKPPESPGDSTPDSKKAPESPGGSTNG